MRWSALLVNLLKLVALAAGVTALVIYWNHRSPSDLVIPDDDDLQTKPMVTVQTGKVTRQTVRSYLEAQGVVEPAAARPNRPAGGADVASPIATVAASVECVEGEKATAGQPLVRLDPRAAAAAVARAQAIFTTADDLANKAARNGTAVRDLDRYRRDADFAKSDLAAAKSALDRLTLTAPIAGTVVRLNIRPGDPVIAGSPLVQIVDLSSMVINCSIPSDHLPLIRPGQTAEVELPTGPAAAAVSFVDPGIDPATGTGSADVAIPAGVTLAPGQAVAVRIVTAEHTGCLVVPTTAIFVDETGQPFVSLVEQDFKWAVRHPVTVGLQDRDYTEIAGPDIKPDADVVTVGTFGLTEKTQIRIAQ
jgi:membrane fusion protein (multidrug efflux system)